MGNTVQYCRSHGTEKYRKLEETLRNHFAKSESSGRPRGVEFSSTFLQSVLGNRTILLCIIHMLVLYTLDPRFSLAPMARVCGRFIFTR
eukprot:COSAG02_NODE_1342_length_13169_cov_11.075905_7_plen_89_part_00